MKESTERLEIRLSQKDKQKLKRAAKRCGVSLSSYVRQCCMGNEARAKPPDEFWRLADELYSVYDGLPPDRQTRLEQLILDLQRAM